MHCMLATQPVEGLASLIDAFKGTLVDVYPFQNGYAQQVIFVRPHVFYDRAGPFAYASSAQYHFFHVLLKLQNGIFPVQSTVRENDHVYAKAYVKDGVVVFFTSDAANDFPYVESRFRAGSEVF